MRYGIVSDIHANIQAWKAVLRDMNNEGVDVILCLGDVVGYGPNPAEVLDSCYQTVDYFILGNHDAVIGNRLDSNLFNDNAKFLIEWTREQLNSAAAGFFADMPMQMEGDGFVCAHAELAIPGRFSYIYEAQDAIESFTSNNSPVMFVGHTHLPAKFAYDLNSNIVRQDPCANSYLDPHERYLINVGSVGDPRDGGTTASYCIYDADTQFLTYRQVPFNVDSFKRNLLKAQLPIQPYFLSVYEGLAQETETIKDMRVMEKNLAATASGTIEKIRKGSDTKTARQKITFSLDDVRSSQKNKETKEKKKSSDAKARKKGMIVVMILFLLLGLSFGGFTVWKKMQSEPVETEKEKIVNRPSEKLVESMKEITVVQKETEDLVLNLDAAKIDGDLEIVSGRLKKWNLASEKLSWKVRINKKGWYSIFADHSEAKEEARIEVKLGPVAVAGNLDDKEGVQKIALMENLHSGTMDFTVSLAEDHEQEVAEIRSITLKYEGEEKPFNYAKKDILLGDFEAGSFSGWVTAKGGFGLKPVSEITLPAEIEIQDISGNYTAASIAVNNEAQGVLRSSIFTIEHRWLAMLLGGGKDCSVRLVVEGKVVEQENFNRQTPLRKFFIDLKSYAGKKGFIEFQDNGAGFIAVDNVTLLSGEPGDFKPANLKTIKGAQKEESVNKINKYLSRAGSKLIKKDFKGCLRDLEEAAVITGTDLSAYTKAVNAVTDLEKLVLSSFEQNIGKEVSIYTQSLKGKEIKVKVDRVKGDTVYAILEGVNSPTPLKLIHLAENSIEEHASTQPGGLLAYHIHKGSLIEKLNELNFDKSTPIGVLVDAATGGVKVSYSPDAVIGSKVEIWALKKSSDASWKVEITTQDGKGSSDAGTQTDIEKVYENFKTEGLKRKVFPVYSYDLITEKQVKEISFTDVKEELNSFALLIRDSRNRIVWMKSFNENSSSQENFLKSTEPVVINFANSQPTIENLAYRKTFTASDSHSGGYKGLNDGVWAFTPPFLFGSSRNAEFPKFVTVDLGEVKEFNLLRFGIPNRGSTKNISLQYSLDNSEFNTIMDFEFEQGNTERYSAHFGKVQARFIRVRFNENYEKTLNRAPQGHVFLSELEAYLLD